jgi:hypothetical protein
MGGHDRSMHAAEGDIVPCNHVTYGHLHRYHFWLNGLFAAWV